MKLNPAKNQTGPRPSHGGDLSVAAELLAKQAGSTDWLDLSTGINLSSYPLPRIDSRVWSSLPTKELEGRCLKQARDYYHVPMIADIVAVNGSQTAIQLLPILFDKTKVSILGPTYSEHSASWKRMGHSVSEYDSLPGLTSESERDSPDLQNREFNPANQIRSSVKCKPVTSCGGLIHAKNVYILVNPNNPDGRLFSRRELEQFVFKTCTPDDWLIIDEAFMDLSPENSAVDLAGRQNCVVLKSFGKFFGLAGLRLGFVIGSEPLIERLSLLLGPWPVAGPSLEVGATALADNRWQNEMRVSLLERKNRLDQLLQKYNFKLTGGSNLFQLIEAEDADILFSHLLQHRIYTRRFNRFPNKLRIGIPSLEKQFVKLEIGLRTFTTNL